MITSTHSSTIMDSTSNKLSLLTDAFGELLRTLNPYLDDLFRQSEFHCFLNIPLELRYKVYEEYVLEENKALACQKWNGVENWPSNLRRRNHKIPFLSPLCRTSHALSSEVLAFIMNSTTFDVSGSYREAGYINRRLSAVNSA
jgi:hypothetical protein